MKVVIVGCGRVGSELARRFEAEGHSVAIVDEVVSAFGRLPETFSGRMILGSGLDEEVLRHAGIDDADAFASVTSGDNRNIMAAQIARTVFKVARVITRLKDPIRAEFYRTMGMETLCTTAIAASVIHDYLSTGTNRAAPTGDMATVTDGMP